MDTMDKVKTVYFGLPVLVIIITVITGNEISISNYEAITPNVQLTHLQHITTTQTVIGCAVFCFQIPSNDSSGFIFFPNNQSCTALEGQITGNLPIPSTEQHQVFRRKGGSLSSATICPNTFQIFNTFCFKLVSQKNGPDSKTICEGFHSDAHLAYVDSLAKLSTVKSFVESNLSGEYYSTYVGIRRRVVNGSYVYDHTDDVLDNTSLWSGSGGNTKEYVVADRSTSFFTVDGSDYFNCYSACEILLS